MKLGSLIKMERLGQEMKQETLAKGICSVSHLSRIENNLTPLSDDFLAQFQDRLGVVLKREYVPLKIDIDRDISVVQELFRNVIDTRDKEAAQGLIKTLLTMQNTHTYYFTELSLMEFRLRLMFKTEVKGVFEYVAKMRLIWGELLPIQHFRILVIEGIANYMCGEIKSSVGLFSKSFFMLDDVLLHESELADFYYVAAVAVVGDNQLYAAIEYSNRAFEYFQREVLGNRMVECMLINGLTYKLSGRYDEALAEFQRAEKLCKQLNLNDFLGRIYQNIGGTYSLKNDSENAISYFKNALIEKKKPDDLIITLFSIVKEHTILDEEFNALKWVQDAFKLLPQTSDDKRIPFTHHLLIYKALNENSVQLEQYCIDALSFFEEKQQYKHCYKYGILLANAYSEQNKRKKAIIYYQKCYQYTLKQKNLMRWENLA